MPTDSGFTHSLFDNTPSAGIPSAHADGTLARSALLGWNSHTFQAVANTYEADEADADDGDQNSKTPPPAWTR